MKFLNGGGRYSEVEIRKWLSDDVVSLDNNQKLIFKANSDNIKNGLFYATATQTIEKIKTKNRLWCLLDCRIKRKANRYGNSLF